MYENADALLNAMLPNENADALLNAMLQDSTSEDLFNAKEDRLVVLNQRLPSLGDKKRGLAAAFTITFSTETADEKADSIALVSVENSTFT